MYAVLVYRSDAGGPSKYVPCEPCGTGVLDPNSCRCIVFPGADNYTSVIIEIVKIDKDIKTINNATATANVTAQLENLKKEIEKLENYTISHQNNLNMTYINEAISYIMKLRRVLSFEMKTYASLLKPNTACKTPCATTNFTQDVKTCKCSCNTKCSGNYTLYKPKCGCVYYPEIITIGDIKANISKTESSLRSISFANATQSISINLYQKQIDVLKKNISDLENYIANNFETMNKTEMSIIIYKIRTLTYELQIKFESWFISLKGVCFNRCGTNNVS